MRISCFFFFFFLFVSGFSQDREGEGTLSYDPVKEQYVFVGPIGMEHFSYLPEFYDIFRENYKAYHPDMDLVAEFAPRLRQSDVLVVMASWCSDTREMLPRFFRILEEAGYPLEDLEMIGVNHLLDSEDEIDPVGTYGVEEVPLFIFFNRLGDEIGRMGPPDERESLEALMVEVFSSN